MDETQRRAVIDSLETAVAATGVELYSGARRLKQWVDKRYPYLDAAQSRASLEKFLTAIDESDENIQQLVLMASVLPKLMEEFVRDAVVEGARQLPVSPGRPVLLTPDMRRAIVAKMLGLIGKKVKMGHAQARCAQEFSVSKRTVQSIWRQRDEIAAQPFQNMNDVWQFLSR